MQVINIFFLILNVSSTTKKVTEIIKKNRAFIFIDWGIIIVKEKFGLTLNPGFHQTEKLVRRQHRYK